VSGYDLVIRGADVVLPDGVARVEIAVTDGVIAAVGPSLGDGREELDATGATVLPGAVDPHVHLDDPGRAHWEGIPTGTAALAVGGATTCIDMPLNSSPVVVDADAFRAKADAVEGRAHVDVALWGGLIPGNLGDLEALADCGVVGFKAFLADSGLPEFPRVDDDELFEGLLVAAGLGLPVAVHAESEAITRARTRRARADGRTGAADWGETRPPAAEAQAIAGAIELCRAAGAALHVVHVSTRRGAELVAAARADGVDVSCETCPHYLAFSEEATDRLGTVAKCAPPLRPEPERRALGEALADGLLPILGSDHSPCEPALKAGPAFLDAWGGINGCQVTSAYALTTLGDLPAGLPGIAALLGGNAAERFGLDGKGRLEPGADADLAVVRAVPRPPLARADLRTRHADSPWLGFRSAWTVERVLLRGRTIALAGKAVGPPSGRLVRVGRGRIVRR
jgi:allantoinase